MFFSVHPISFFCEEQGLSLFCLLSQLEKVALLKEGALFNNNSFYIKTTELCYFLDTVNRITDQVSSLVARHLRAKFVSPLFVYTANA